MLIKSIHSRIKHDYILVAIQAQGIINSINSSIINHDYFLLFIHKELTCTTSSLVLDHRQNQAHFFACLFITDQLLRQKPCMELPSLLHSQTKFMSSYTVTRVSKSLVTPSEPTPTNETLTLSVIDRVPGLRHCVRSIHAFKHGQEPAEVIKEALSKALVHYYPFAGRFIDPVSPATGEVTVVCSGEGVYFMKAKANCSLEDVKYLDLPLMIPEQELLPEPHPDVPYLDMPLLMQVNRL